MRMQRGWVYRKILVWVLLVHFSCQKERSDNSFSWDQLTPRVQVLGGSHNESAHAVIPTMDGGFAVLGHAQSNDQLLADKKNTSYDMWLLRFDETGELLWHKTYGGKGNDRGLDLIETNKGDFVLLGFSEGLSDDWQSETSTQNLWLVQVDSRGTIRWEKTYGFAGSDYGTQLIANPDGGFVVAGVLDVTASGGEGNKHRKHAGGDFWVLRLDTQGELLWRNYFGGLQSDTPNDLVATQDGGYLVVGTTDSADTDIAHNRGSYDCWVIKLNPTGQLEWEATFGGSQIDTAYAIQPTPNGNYRIVGDSRSIDQQILSNKGAADLWTFEMAPDGTLIQEKCYGGSNFDAGRSLFLLEDGNWLLAGNSRSADGDLLLNKGQNDAWTLILDATADRLLWSQNIGGSLIDTALDAIQLQNGTLVTVGETSSADGDISDYAGFTDALVIINSIP